MAQFFIPALFVCVGFLIAAWIYVRALLWVGSRFRGGVKVTIGFLIYLLVAIFIVASLIYMHGQSEFPWWANLLAWCVSISPGMYLIATQRKRLQDVGFFMARNS
jgi:hypothetical protein